MTTFHAPLARVCAMRIGGDRMNEPLLIHRICDLVCAREQHPLTRYESPLHVPISGSQIRGWDIWMNGSGTSQKIIGADPGTMADGCSVPPFSAAIFWNGWLAGFVDPGGGVCVAGKMANEDALLAALDEAIDAARVGVAT